jgi:hypothetical protein
MAGVVMHHIAKDSTPQTKIYPRTFVSTGHNKTNATDIYNTLNSQITTIKNNLSSHKGKFRVNQIQTTPPNDSSIINSDSLIYMADTYNWTLLPYMVDWIKTCPVVWGDNIDNTNHSWHSTILSYINNDNVRQKNLLNQ